jgi:uncharacterized protein DUF1254
VGEIGRFAYFWAWPMVNVYNRFTSLKRIWRPILIGGIAPVAPINHLAMLHDYIGPRQRYITCPSQDLIYGFGILDLGREPVVVQVPDFGKRYWVYQATDLRTDGFAELGAMYDTKPGFYLLVGPDWQGKQPDGITATFRAATNVGTIVPRVFQEDTRADNAALQPLIRQIAAYPLSEFDGAMKSRDWSSLPSIPWIKLGNEEWKWVEPKSFFDVLPEVLDACPPLPGEEGLYALVRSVLAAGAADPALRCAGGRGCRGRRRSREASARVPQFRHPAPSQLDHGDQQCGVRHRLLHAHRRRQVEHLHQPPARDALFLPGPRRQGRAALGLAKIHPHLRRAGAGQGLLVDHPLRPASLLRAERARALLARHQKQRAALRA